MQFTLIADHVCACFGGEVEAQKIVNDMRWKHGSQRVMIDTDTLNDEQLKQLLDYTCTCNKAAHTKLSTWLTLRKDPEGAKVRNLQQLQIALRSYIQEAVHRWVFCEGDDDALVPWLVVDITYHPPEYHRGDYSPPYVDMDLEAVYRNKKVERTIYWHLDDLVGKKQFVSELLAAKDAYRETEESFVKWEADLATYNEIVRLTGVQFFAFGSGYKVDEDRYWWHHDLNITFMRDGRPSRVVMDDEGDPDEEKQRNREKEHAGTERQLFFWKKDMTQKARREAEESGDVPDGSELMFHRPVQPYVQVFSFEVHEFLQTHVSNLKLYVYAEDLQKKLILPEQIKRIVTTLIEGAAHMMEDIVSGKVGGVIVIATGYPGTGKTLTAEVYSEQIKRPLYVVQCAQLGTDQEKLEETLSTVLGRASRWGSILLIDEADVYVRARGDDLQQNAIVGVFLRLLERFSGVLFMTSNRATVIDDAIMSRAIAHIRYELPSTEELALIWEVLADNYKIALFPKDIARLVEALPCISGRNVKTLLRLATSVSRKQEYGKGEIVELIKSVAQFVDFPPSHYEAVKHNSKK